MFSTLAALLGVAIGLAAGWCYGLRPESGRSFRDLRRHKAGREQQEREYLENLEQRGRAALDRIVEQKRNTCHD
jgi:hypothetical protein